MEISQEICQCFNPQARYDVFESESIGVDETHGRFGSVDLKTCKACQRKWLRYHVEYEAFSRSGRWYRGLIPDEEVSSITPENAVEFLEGLEWTFCGGSYFESAGELCKGGVFVDL